MAGKPIATVGSNHTCPMCNGTVPHVGGPITQGEANILINNKPAATIGSICTCVGPPDTIVQGNASVFFNGKPVASIGDMTAHGGVVISGEVNVTVSSSSPSSTASMPIDKIPFPEITIINKTIAALSGNAKSLKKAIENQEKIRELAEKQEDEQKDKELPKLQGEILFVHGYLSDPVTNSESHWNAIMDLNPDKPGWYTLRGENTNEYNRIDHSDYYSAKQVNKDKKPKSTVNKIIDGLLDNPAQRIASKFSAPKEKYTGYWDSKSNQYKATETYAKHFNAKDHVHYVNGSHGLGSSGAHRIDHGISLGYEWARFNWDIYDKEKIDAKKEEKPNIESHSPPYRPITIVGHSQGCNMAAGVKLGIIRYAFELGWDKIAINTIFLGVHQPSGLYGERYDKLIKKKVYNYMVNQNAMLFGKEEDAGIKFLNLLSDLYNPKYKKVYNNRGLYEHVEEITADFGSAFRSRAVQFTFSNDRGDLVTIDGDIPKIKSACNPKKDKSLFSAEYFSKKESIPSYYQTTQNKEIVDLSNHGAKSGFIAIPPYHLNRRFDFNDVDEKSSLEEVQYGKEWGDYKKVAVAWGVAMNAFKISKKDYEIHAKHKFDPTVLGEILLGNHLLRKLNKNIISFLEKIITIYKDKPKFGSLEDIIKFEEAIYIKLNNVISIIKIPKHLKSKLLYSKEDKLNILRYNIVYIAYQNMLFQYAALQNADLYAHFSPVALILHKKTLSDFPDDELDKVSIIQRIFNAGDDMFYRMVYEAIDGKEVKDLTEEEKRGQEKKYVTQNGEKLLIDTYIADTDYINNVIKAYVKKDKTAEKDLYDEEKHKP